MTNKPTIAVLCPGPSLEQWDIDLDYFDYSYAVNQAVLAHPGVTAFIALDGDNKTWWKDGKSHFPHHLPQITQRDYPCFPKHTGQFSFPTLLAYIHTKHPGSTMHWYGVDYGGRKYFSGETATGHRWGKETREVVQVLGHIDPSLVINHGEWDVHGNLNALQGGST